MLLHKRHIQIWSKCWQCHLHFGILILWLNHAPTLWADFWLYGICLIYFVHLISFIVFPFPLHRVYCLTILTMQCIPPRHVEVRSWQPPRKRFNSISLMHCHCQLGLFLVNFSSVLLLESFTLCTRDAEGFSLELQTIHRKSCTIIEKDPTRAFSP